jgi:threonine/homoserine/homoserine lactone efflux protein
MESVTIDILLKGILVGFLIAAPVGPMGILCVKRTLTFGPLAGIISGLGAATADAIFAVFAGFGIGAIAYIIESKQSMIELFGGIILIVLGIITFIHKSKTKLNGGNGTNNLGALGNYFSSFFLTITNPITILAVGALFAGFGVIEIDGQTYETLTLILGVFIGSAAWFLGLSLVIGILLHKRLTDAHMQKVNMISSIIFIIFGVSILIYALL